MCAATFWALHRNWINGCTPFNIHINEYFVAVGAAEGNFASDHNNIVKVYFLSLKTTYSTQPIISSSMMSAIVRPIWSPKKVPSKPLKKYFQTFITSTIKPIIIEMLTMIHVMIPNFDSVVLSFLSSGVFSIVSSVLFLFSELSINALFYKCWKASLQRSLFSIIWGLVAFIIIVITVTIIVFVKRTN